MNRIVFLGMDLSGKSHNSKRVSDALKAIKIKKLFT